MTGSSTSSTATTWRSESPAAPASADHSRPRSPRRARCRTLPHHDRRDHRDHRGAGARVRSLRAVSALRQWGDSVRNRAPLDQKQSEKSVTKLRAMQQMQPHRVHRVAESAETAGPAVTERLPECRPEAQWADAHKPRRRRYWPVDADELAERLVKPQLGVGGRPEEVRLPLPDVFRSPSSKRMRHPS